MPTRVSRRRAALLAWLASAWLLLACAPALAHANLVEASPPQGGQVSEPPGRVELRFNEPVDAEFDPVVVRDSDGARVDDGDARVDPQDARVVLAPLKQLPEGSYDVEWRVTSIDGHVVEGRYGFAVTWRVLAYPLGYLAPLTAVPGLRWVAAAYAGVVLLAVGLAVAREVSFGRAFLACCAISGLVLFGAGAFL